MSRSARAIVVSTAVALVTASSGPAGAAPLSLTDAYKRALRASPSLALMRARIAQARATHRRAWSTLLPTASVVGSFTHNQFEATLDFSEFIPPGSSLPVPDPVVIQKRNQFGFDAAAKLPLFRGPAYPQIGVAKKGIEQARLRRIQTRGDYLLSVARVYYTALGQKEAVKARDNKVKLDERNLKAAQARFQLGQAMRSDVMQAELVLTQDKQALVRQRLLLDASRRELGLMIGTRGAVDVVEPPLPKAPAGEPRALVGRALERRADLRADAVAVDAARQGKRAAWWQFAPLLDANFVYSWREASGFSGQNGAYILTLNLTLPIYDDTRYAALKKSQAEIGAAEAQRRARILAVSRQVVRLRAELLASEAELVSAKKAEALARTTAEDMLARYEAGTAIQLNVLDASQRLLEAELTLTRARYTRDLARIALSHAVGGFSPLR